MGMRLTDEMIQEDDKRFKRQDLLAEFNYCGKEVPKRKSITNDDIRFYAWLCRSAYALLKDPDRIKVTRCKDCRYFEPSNAEEGDHSGYCRNDYAPCQNQTVDAWWFCGSAERG